MKKGDKILCIKTLNNIFGEPLCIKNQNYTVLETNGLTYFIINHILYTNEYGELSMSDFDKYFLNIKKTRKNKIIKLYGNI